MRGVASGTPSNRLRMLTPSICFAGSGVPAISAKVGSRSMDEASWLQIVPAGVVPGHHTMHGTRCPPSKVVPLPSRRPPVEPAWSP